MMALCTIMSNLSFKTRYKKRSGLMMQVYGKTSMETTISLESKQSKLITYNFNMVPLYDTVVVEKSNLLPTSSIN